MRVDEARAAAADWVVGRASREPAFLGAYFTGSTVGMATDAELPVASDVDVAVVLDVDEAPAKAGKFVHLGALVEVTYLPWHEVREALGTHYLAGGLRTDTIIADPSGRLRPLQAVVAEHFSDEKWVRHRSEAARRRVETRLRALDDTAPWHQQVMGWVFPTGVTAHVLLVAAQRDPTVRLRYLAVRPVAPAPVYRELLEQLGCADWTPARVGHHLDRLATTFDLAADAARTPLPFSTDLTPAARPIAIDGTRELIDAGDHREAVFWMVVTHTRCHTALALDAPDAHREARPAFDDLMADLGITTTADLRARAERTLGYLPELWAAAEDLMRR
ncbi:hypothetical protein [Umezawaea sp. Da 62-37]|uniref:hypothetical protein n=1 Tax=Umezawaea sp. Da 62-37 TaxID=3075927 RepID=UPI0028F6DC4C|nr:hypothetical protein [Umezawaea sp. Da 62-37]WNV84009.1 hypothetical protein RM788_38480 [Umezawaea sp. Da 62-37]